MSIASTGRGAFVASLVLCSSPSHATEKWSCEYAPYRPEMAKVVSSFRVEGRQLIQYSGDAIVNYQLLEDSKGAIVAANEVSYAFEPWVIGRLVMIRKDTGDFLFVTASMGKTNARQAGTCRSIEEPNAH